MPTDIEIANNAPILPIQDIASKIGIGADELEPYGRYKAKLPLTYSKAKPKGKLVLVTAISPTPAGEGKTTTSIGLTDGLNAIGVNAMAVLREPSLGPVFGMKGGAAGGGYAQVIPMEDINLHFTGDFAAIEKANNLLAAIIDNHIHQGNSLNIDPRTVIWRRVMDMNDRSLRNIISGVGGKNGGILREAGFDITAASEIMAILCLSSDFADLKQRINRIYIGNTYSGEAVYAAPLLATEAMAILLKDAIKPNLVQTLEGNPALIHGGPFANIAQGTNTAIATKTGLALADVVVTEAGFGADLGAEKFINIKCRQSNLTPNAIVIVATIKALKYHGGAALNDLKNENLAALENGFKNLKRHVENSKNFGLPVVVAINRFVFDTESETALLARLLKEINTPFALCEAWEKGGEGAKALAHVVTEALKSPSSGLKLTYRDEEPIKSKIESIAKQIYRASAVTFSSKALSDLKRIEKLNLNHLQVCMAKTQYSFSDNPKAINAASDFELNVREIQIAAGAGFVVPICGEMMRMPGLPKEPASNHMFIDDAGQITGLS